MMIQPSTDGFWATLELLVDGINSVISVDPFYDDIEDWLDTLTNKVRQQKKRLKNTEENHSENDDADDVYHVSLLDCSFSNPPVRSRLEMLMGNNVVRLTDRKYMLRLVARIRQDYEIQQQKRIEDRKKNELMRTKMMILNRLISVHDAPSEIRQYPLFQLYLYCDAIITEKRKKYSPKQRKIASSLYKMLYPEQKNDDKSNEKEKGVYMKRVYVDGVPELVQMTEEEIISAKKEIEASKEIDDGYILAQKEYDKLHYEATEIKELREAQKVEDMYAKAHSILGILYSHVDRNKAQEKTEKVSNTTTLSQSPGESQ